LTILAAALAFGLGSRPMSTRADGLTSRSDTSNTSTVMLEYTLITSQAYTPAAGSPPAVGSSNVPTPQIVATVSPVSIVHPPNPNDPALQIVSDSTGFFIKNPPDLSPSIGNLPPDGGASITQQALGLSFYGHGFAPGDSLKFALPFSQSIVGGSSPQTIPQFSAVDPATGLPISWVKITYDGPLTTGGGVSPQAVPEPLSLLVWTALAGAVLLRARAWGRRPAEASGQWSVVSGQ
jgi:hypothetical protein